MEIDKEFNCWKCGWCCKQCNLTEELKNFDRGDGQCRHLQPDNSCGIYESRPEICNTRKMYQKHHSRRMTWNEYVDMSEVACKMIEAEGIKRDKEKERK